MKTILEIPDELFRQAKSRAAATGAKLEELVADGLRLVLSGGVAHRPPRRVQFPIIKPKPRAPVITRQSAEEAERQLLREEAEQHARLMRGCNERPN